MNKAFVERLKPLKEKISVLLCVYKETGETTGRINKALDVFLICPVVFKKGADVLKFPVVKCEHILMYRLKDISCFSRKIYNLTPVTFYSFIGEFLSLLKRVYWG